MPPPNPKNSMANGFGLAAADLGLADYVDESLLSEEERRKRLERAKQGNPALYGDSVLSTAAMQLFPTQLGK